MKNNVIIIFSTFLFLLLSFVFLSVVEMKQADIDTKNIWMIYFEDPKDNSLDFAIENHSEDENFHWEVFEEKNKVKDGDVSITKGSVKNIPLSISDKLSKKITIIVTQGENKKEIYKSL